MRILHILNCSDYLTGAENVAADICMMYKGEHNMAYCSPDGPLRQDLEDRNVQFIPLKKMTISELRRAINAFKPDIIHAHDIRATVFAACVSSGIPVISHLHANMEDMRKIGLKSFLYLLASIKVKKVIVVSESCLLDYIFKKQIEKKTICIRNIIYTPRIELLIAKDQNEYDFDFVYIGRLCNQKNPERVAKVASAVLKQCPSATFGIIGEGMLKSNMEAVFQKEGIIEKVVFTGKLAYPYKALKQAKCMLMCSRYEGTPIAALEAMALGVPIVSTPVDGMSLIVDNGVTGFLSDEDTILVSRVYELLSNSQLKNDMSENAKSRLKQIFDYDAFKDKLEEVYMHVFK